MLWYLLYPIRGTTQPPRLSANHPVRRAFYRHGKTTAEHWLVAMLVTVAVAMGFSYPTILISENPTAGIASLPHQVWTTAKPFDGDPKNIDVEMRQVWIHGSYMRALEKDVLQNALKIQHTLVGDLPLASITPELSQISWGFHSPLMYWNNSQEIINSDDDILKTINDQARTTSSSLNVALRPASVFAGKKFDHRKLTKADALVITLMNKMGDGVGDQWRNNLASLTRDACANCTFYPRDGHVTRNRMYEFSFTPLSLRENLALTIAYSGMAVYVLLSLRRLKAFHSRLGLVVTAITQMTCSILASFTICEVLKINLSMIPQNAYPFVVLVLGIENMFRIINGVLAYPPTMATELRIANALGDVGPVSAAAAVQNVIILSLLSRLVSPGVAAFCAFACIATLFDAFFLLTFFVAVLNVDIRRFELQDALARANQSKHRRKPSPVHNNTWFNALVHGTLPFSTRMAGTAVTVTFVLSLNYHFFEHEEKATSLRHLLNLLKEGPPTMNEFDTFTPPPMNVSLTPTQWMRMQDFDTAKEVLRLAKPGASTFIIRIFAPLIVVLSGADRIDDRQDAWTTALRSFALHHFYPVTVAVVFAVTFVAVLMNFLLYTEHADDPAIDLDREDEAALKVSAIALPHKLDIVKLSGNEKSHFVTAGLDRTIAISVFDRNMQARRILGLHAEALSQIAWPIHSMTIDDGGDWMACHCADDRILIYSLFAGSFLKEPLQYPDDNPPLLFEFARMPYSEGSKIHLVVLTSGGRLAIKGVDTGESIQTRLVDVPILGAKITELSSQGKRLLVVTDEANVMAYTWISGQWIRSISQALPVPTLQGRLSGSIHIDQHSETIAEFLIVTTSRQAIILENQSLTVLAKLDAGKDEASLSLILHRLMLGQATTCTSCASPAFRCAALVGSTSHDDDCIMTTLWATGGDDAVICVRNSTTSCQPFEKAQRTTHHLSNSGVWSAVTSQSVLGLRKIVTNGGSEVSNSGKPSTLTRMRRRNYARSSAQLETKADLWEAYKLSLDGELETIDVVDNDNADSDLGALYVSSAGPAISLDSQTIAVAFGNTVKIIRSIRRGSMSRRPTGRTFERILGSLQDAASPQSRH